MKRPQRAIPLANTALSAALVVLLLLASGRLARPAIARAEASSAPAAGATAAVPVDPQQAGEPAEAAKKELIPTKNLLSIMDKGGILMWPIAFCSVLVVAFTFERLVSLRRRRVIPRPFVTRLLQQVREGELDRQQALALCAENGSTVAEVFAGAVYKWGRPAVEVEQAVIDAGERATTQLRRYLRVFNIVHTVAPLLGLLGTVFGMIKAFNMVAVSDALGRPELLANGISEALLTTAAGLTVAIPALLLYYFFVSRVDHLVVEIDGYAQELVNMVSAEALQNRPADARNAKSRRAGRQESSASV